ncbi:hypothetical protein EB001_05970 [bacterium]|nr:hypothetical protein [bacterium]
MRFAELKPTQKMYVIEVMNRFDHDRDAIELIEMQDYHKVMVSKRDAGCPKLGYPNWLIVGENKISKGVYGFPRPTDSELEDYHSGNVEAVVDLSKFSPLLNNVIKEYGLKP